MKCPQCENQNLQMSERQGVEIDYCPQCRGVWLDRGELDKLIERSAAVSAPAPAQPSGNSSKRRSHDDDDDRRHAYSHYQRKPKSWLSEIFD